MSLRAFTKLRTLPIFFQHSNPCRSGSHRSSSREISTTSPRHTHDPEPYLNVQDVLYSGAHTTLPPENIQAIYQKTTKNFSNHFMMVSQLQGSLLMFLVQMRKSKRVLELGTYTGYSAACFAEALRLHGDGAKVVTLEKDELYQRTAKENIETAGYSGLVEFHLGDASELLETLDNSVPYDLVFMDANKGGYRKSYDTILKRNLLSDDGIIVADNVLHRGYVSKAPEFSSVPSGFRNIIENLHHFNEHVAKDPRTTQVMLPFSDGLTLIRKVT